MKDPLNPIAIPTDAIRPTAASLVPRAMYPKNLRVVGRMMSGQGGLSYLPAKAPGTKRKHTVTVGKVKLKQQDRSFILPGSFGKQSWGVWERIGSGKRDVRMIWKFEKAIAIPRLLSFEDDARRIIDARLRVNFDGLLASALGGGQGWGNKAVVSWS